MKLDEKLRKKQYDLIWQEYCGFLDLSMPQYMEIQNRLMKEQLELLIQCELGHRIMKGRQPATINEFRKAVPLTTYEDYADFLLIKDESVLPAKPSVWIETTWESVKHPIKTAPYTEGMLHNCSNCVMAIMVLMTSDFRGEFTLRGGENILSGWAQLPYLTGLMPYLISNNCTMNFMPPTNEAETMAFRGRTKAGFKMGLQKGVDLFFGLSSIVAKMGEAFMTGSGSEDGFSIFNNSAKMNRRLLKAWIRSKRENIPIRPRDIWDLKGVAIAGPDSTRLKPRIEEYWGVRPLEIFAGTEAACIATETWEKDGLVFYPDVDFYEFIPKGDIEKQLDNPDHRISTYLMDELVAGYEYELVISNFKGGAFVRYRTGDIFKCLSLKNKAMGINLPHFAYLDRYPTIIDIGGFTRITEDTINQALQISKLDVDDWFAVKEVGEENKACLHIYTEIGIEGMRVGLNPDIVQEHLNIYFRHIDSDYRDLNRMLGIDPLKVTVIPRGTMGQFLDSFGRHIRRINPPHYDVVEMLKIAGDSVRREVS